MNNPPRITQVIDRILERTILRLLPTKVTPNALTMLRFVLTPIVVLLVWGEFYLIGTSVFILAAFTDALDGALARTTKQITEWGKVYDPLADKTLIALIAVILITRYLGGWLAIAVVIIELGIMANGVYWIRSGHKVEAKSIGKLKMVVQVLAVICLLLFAGTGIPVVLRTARYLVYAAIVLALSSVVQYASI